jgi:catalase
MIDEKTKPKTGGVKADEIKQERVLTNRQGHPVYDNQNQRTVGPRGPATLENYQFLEKISHFDRERIPERVVHARGAVAYGFFDATSTWGDEPIGKYTRAKVFQEGKRTDLAIRFSTVIGGRDSSEAARDPRGFAIKFYTEDGNWDLVGNNWASFSSATPSSSRRDPRAQTRPCDLPAGTEPHLRLHVADARVDAHARQPLLPAWHSRKLPHPAGLRRQHLQVGERRGRDAPRQIPLAAAPGREVADRRGRRQPPGDRTRPRLQDLYEAIERGEYPKWDLLVQLMSDDEHPELEFDPLDDTKVWPEGDFPPKKVGTMTLNANVATSTTKTSRSLLDGCLVDGLDFSDDKMLVGRTFSYSDAQRYRVGPNYLQLPVNQARNARLATNQRGGQMSFGVDLAEGQNLHVNYEPSGLTASVRPTPDGSASRGRSSKVG